ncbi:hypothetical protein Tco_0701193 [Tanacetum coccineum]
MVCMDDNMSCMKEWENGFFYIDRRAIPDSMPWRHANSVITDPKTPANTYDLSEARRLSAFVVKLRDIPKGVLVLSGLSEYGGVLLVILYGYVLALMGGFRGSSVLEIKSGDY